MSSLRFASTSDHMYIGSPAILDDMSVGSIVCWFKNPNPAVANRFYDKGAAGTLKYFRINPAGNMDALWSRATTNLSVTASAGAPAVGAWSFCAFTFDLSLTSTDQHIYSGSLNTVVTEVASYSTRNVGSGAIVSDAAETAKIGKTCTDGIAWLQIYNRQLSIGDLRRLQFRSRALSGCIGHWRLESVAGITDISGQKNNGTPAGTVTLGPGAPLFASDGPRFPLGANFVPPSSYVRRRDFNGGLVPMMGGVV